MSGIPRKLSIALVVLVFLMCVYRARTQGFTVDEAFCFRGFVNQDLTAFLERYDACNHVLHTLITKFFRSKFGISELELRLGSLLGCVIYLWASLRLSRLYFRDTWLSLLSVAVLTLNPLVLDFLVAARGYGLAAALLLAAMYCLSVYWMCGRNVRWMWGGGVLAGLSVAANLVFLVPAAALGAVLLVMALRDGRRALWRVIENYGGPSVVTAFVILVLPLLRAKHDNFYYGAPTFWASMSDSVRSALWKVPDRWPARLLDASMPLVTDFIVPLLAIAVCIGLVYVLYRFIRLPEPLPYRLVPFALFAGAFAGSLLLVWLMGQFGVLYPLGRTGLYFIPLFTLALLTGAALVPTGPRKFAYAIPVLLVFVYVTQLDTTCFAEWRFDAGTARLLRRMQEDYVALNNLEWRPTVAASPLLENTIEYYRVRRKMQWMGPLNTSERGTRAADYYLLVPEDAEIVNQLDLVVLDRNRVSGEILARRRF